MENDISCKWKQQESGSSNTHIRQKRLPNKGYNKRQRRVLYNGKGIKQEENIILVNIFAPKTGAPKYINQILTLKGRKGQ